MSVRAKGYCIRANVYCVRANVYCVCQGKMILKCVSNQKGYRCMSGQNDIGVCQGKRI